MKIARGEEPEEAPPPPMPALTPIAIPYAFARRFGVALTGPADAPLTVALKEDGDPRALIELRRFFGRPFAIQKVAADRFDRILSEAYAMDGQAAADAAGSLGLGDELAMLATDLPTADDLLDSADDAPAIRLINGIIADAARQGVSTFISSLMRRGSSSACASTACCAKRCGCRRMSRPWSSAASR